MIRQATDAIFEGGVMAADEPLTDLGLAVLLLNSVDLLEDPADRMAEDLSWWRRALTRHGHADLAAAQREDARGGLLERRGLLRVVVEGDDEEEARQVLNVALLAAGAVVQLGPDRPGVTGSG